MLERRVRIGTAGRLVIPAAHRKALGLDAGDEVVLVLENDELRLTTQQTAIRHAQELVRQHVPRERSLVDELIEERRGQAGVLRKQRETG